MRVPAQDGGFNSRAHAGRDDFFTSCFVESQCFNSRAHAGRDNAHAERIKAEKVSIHAPTRGATAIAGLAALAVGFNSRAHAGRDEAGRCGRIVYGVSIHAPTRGATIAANTLRIFKLVSIHAPTRGATLGRDYHKLSYCSFNSRAHAGRDKDEW